MNTVLKNNKNAKEQELLKQSRKNARNKYFFQFKNVFTLVMFVVLLIFSISYIYALYWGLISSLKDVLNYSEDIFGFPRKFQWTNYSVVMENLKVRIVTQAGRRDVYFVELLFNSIVFAVVGTTIPVVTQSCVAYAATKYDFKFNKVLNFCVVFVIVVPPLSSLGADLSLYKALGIYDNFFGLMLTRIAWAGSGFLVWSGVFKGVSSEYMDAAKIDGAGHFRILISVMFPLVRIPFLIMWVQSFIVNWSSYSVQYTMLPSMPNLALALWHFQFDVGNAISWPPMQLAGAMMVMRPCLLLYICFNKWFVGNLTAGGLKG